MFWYKQKGVSKTFLGSATPPVIGADIGLVEAKLPKMQVLPTLDQFSVSVLSYEKNERYFD